MVRAGWVKMEEYASVAPIRAFTVTRERMLVKASHSIKTSVMLNTYQSSRTQSSKPHFPSQVGKEDV
jgi:hypothetical protein